MRILNNVLKKFVRDKQPPEVLEAVRLRTEGQSPAADKAERTQVSPQLAEFFVKDAASAVLILDDRLVLNSDEGIKLYTTTVHSMKTALANVGESELSTLAKKLEEAGTEKNTDYILEATPAFVKQLRNVIDKFTPNETDENPDTGDVDFSYLSAQLIAIKNACDGFDNKAAKEIIIELRQKTWPTQIKELLGDMAEQLLSGDLDDVVVIADRIDTIASEPNDL